MSEHDNDTCPHLVRASLLEAENARLKAEVERLRIAGGESEPRFVFLSDYRHLKAERDTLKAEVERLRKAGDAMVSHIRHGEDVCFECLDGDPVINDWNAAKRGKQP